MILLNSKAKNKIESTLLTDTKNQYYVTGTSAAAPFVTGTVALLYQLKPSLKAQPDVVKAILMASCHRKVLSSEGNSTENIESGLTAHQGAGVINPYISVAIAGSGNYGIRSIPEGSTETSVRFIQPRYDSSGLNFSIAWLRKTESTDSDGDYIDLDLELSNSQTTKTSTKPNSAAEMCYIKPLPNQAIQEYTANISNFTNTAEVTFAYAFSVSNLRYQHDSISSSLGNLSDGIYLLRNSASNLFLTNSGGNLIQCQSTAGQSQLWLIKNNNITSVPTQKNKLSVGNPLGNNYYRAVLNSSTAATLSITPQTSSNQGYTNYLGTYKINAPYNNSTYALAIYNQSTNNNATAAWKSSSASDNTQKWYLERAAYQRGDVNINGYINNADKTLLSNYLNETATLTDTQLFLADIDGNGVVNSTDKNLISNCFTQ